MSRDNFYICTDRDNKRLHLTRSKPSVLCSYWIEYRDNKPLRGHLHPEEVQIYDYSVQEFFAVHDGSISLTGHAMPKIQNFQFI